MASLESQYQQQVLAEIETIPEKHLPLLLQMIRSYRDSVLHNPAAESFRQGWKEALSATTFPVDRL